MPTKVNAIGVGHARECRAPKNKPLVKIANQGPAGVNCSFCKNPEAGWIGGLVKASLPGSASGGIGFAASGVSLRPENGTMKTIGSNSSTNNSGAGLKLF